MIKHLLWLFLPVCWSAGAQNPPAFREFTASFATGYQNLNIPGLVLDYREYFNAIPASDQLDLQESFFRQTQTGLSQYTRADLPREDRITYDHLVYETAFNLRRIALEKAWVADGRSVQEGGLHGLKNQADWYRFFIQRFTGLTLSPEDIHALGEREMARVKKEIKTIQTALGFTDDAFYRHLRQDTFYIRDRQTLVDLFEKTDQTIRRNLTGFIGAISVPPIDPLEWDGAGPNTPPGIYLPHTDNPYGRDVFKYNFYGGRYNRRAVEWLYMHEGIPGHHLQWTWRWAHPGQDSIQSLFFYPGNAEGWGCYVEYEGKALGLYQDPYSELGKWEWDLVRSARLVLDYGIHAEGWTREQALAYWRANIPNQDDIAEREVTRVTNWAAQALSYKAGADAIVQLKSRMRVKAGAAFDEKQFHRVYLGFGMRPLEVVVADFEEALTK